MNHLTPLAIVLFIALVAALVWRFRTAVIFSKRIAEADARAKSALEAERAAGAKEIEEARAKVFAEKVTAQAEIRQQQIIADADIAHAWDLAKKEMAAFKAKREEEVVRAKDEVETDRKRVEESLETERRGLVHELEKIKAYYDSRLALFQQDAANRHAETLAQLNALLPLKELGSDPEAVRATLESAVNMAKSLEEEVAAQMQKVKEEAQRLKDTHRAKIETDRKHAEELLKRATEKACQLVEAAEAEARKIGGDAYEALRLRDSLAVAVESIKNVIDGYGDKYVVPSHSMVDELAQGYGHLEAGKRLNDAREQSRRMVVDGFASSCDYVETNRRETAIRFVTDAFNGRVDAILTEVDAENIGTLKQQINDAFNLVNLNGMAFRNARILPAYLKSRLDELEWAVATYELREREREEQRRIKEQIREEEKARKEYERALREAQQEEDRAKKLLEVARREVEKATEAEMAAYQIRLSELETKLREAEANNQRALSMAQQTRKGHVYIISNIGSFGDDVFKIGMTRRLEPMDRIWELGDASVPFDFDVHAMIPSDDAPALEGFLHEAFEENRVNLANNRKEFFRVSAVDLRSKISEKGLQATFTDLAEAREFRETQAMRKQACAI